MPLSGCSDFPSPCAVAGHAPGRAPGRAATRTLLGLASHFCKPGLAALVPRGLPLEFEHAGTVSGYPARKCRREGFSPDLISLPTPPHSGKKAGERWRTSSAKDLSEETPCRKDIPAAENQTLGAQPLVRPLMFKTPPGETLTGCKASAPIYYPWSLLAANTGHYTSKLLQFPELWLILLA